MPPLDLKKLAAEVSVQHGIRVDQDDPMMVAVTINRVVFEHSVAAVMEKLEAITRGIDDATARVQVRAGSALAHELKQCFADLERQARKQMKALEQPREKVEAASFPRAIETVKWVSLGLAAGLVLILAESGSALDFLLLPDWGHNSGMRMFLFWFTVLSPKARVGFLVLIGLFLYAVSRRELNRVSPVTHSAETSFDFDSA